MYCRIGTVKDHYSNYIPVIYTKKKKKLQPTTLSVTDLRIKNIFFLWNRWQEERSSASSFNKE